MSSKPTLLYAEDDMVSRENYTYILRPFFQEIIVASNGEEALALYRKHKPDLLLLDISMPLMDGLELTKAVRTQDSEIPIVILTAHSDQKRLLEAVNLKLDGYMLKPVDDKKLLETIQQLLTEIEKAQKVELAGNLLWDKNATKLYHKDTEIKLTKKERHLIESLCTHPGTYLTHDDLIYHIWQEDFPDHTYNKKLIQLIYRLNKKVSTYLPAGSISSRTAIPWGTG